MKFLGLIFILFAVVGFGQQNKIDSLEKQFSLEKNDEKKILLLGDLCWEYLLISNFEKGIEEPDEILNQMRAGVIKALGQDVKTNEKRKDGMDADICCWVKSTNKLSFSGANNCLWIVRNSP